MKAAALFAVALAVSAASAAERRPTDVLFFFDTEDYTCDRSNDAIRDLANILTSEGVKGQFVTVGFLAQRLMEYRRFDVIDSLRGHVIGSQSMYHSLHPNICEMTDLADYREAHRRILAQEAECVGMLKAVFGRDHVDYFAPPGNSVTYAGMAACTDLGMTFYCAAGFSDYPKVNGKAYGTGGLARRDNLGRGLWYFNMMQIPYSSKYQMEVLLLPKPGKPAPDYARILDGVATHDLTALYMHPHMVVKATHPDDYNFRYENKVEWRKWIAPPDRPAGDTAIFYERFRELVRRFKADKRFRVTNLEELRRELPPRRTIVPADLPAVKAALATKFGPVSMPASYSVADVFQAAARFLRGEKTYVPGACGGFLKSRSA